MTAPFADAQVAEVLIRTLRQLVVLEHRKHPSTLHSWGAMKSYLWPRLPHTAQVPDLATALLAADAAISSGVKFDAWCAGAVLRSRAGNTWRGCFYQPYKATRDPRVTNRGVRAERALRGD